MKNINFKIYSIAIILSILSVIVFNISQGQSSFVAIFLGMTLGVLLFNISSILFYKVLTTKTESVKYTFSFLHIINIIVIGFILSGLF